MWIRIDLRSRIDLRADADVVGDVVEREVRRLGDVRGADDDSIRFIAQRTAIDDLQLHVGGGKGNRRVAEVKFERVPLARSQRGRGMRFRYDDLLRAIAAGRRGFGVGVIENAGLVATRCSADNFAEIFPVRQILVIANHGEPIASSHILRVRRLGRGDDGRRDVFHLGKKLLEPARAAGAGMVG